MVGAVALLGEDARSPIRSTASVLPIFLLDSTIRAAMRSVGGGAAGGLATARAIGLARIVTTAMQLAKLKVAGVVVAAACLVGAGTTSFSFFTKTSGGSTASVVVPEDADGTTTAKLVPTEPAPGDVADGKTQPTTNEPKAMRSRADDVCKLDAVHRLKELVEQLWLGGRKDKGPGLTPEQHSEIRHSEDLQAHPYPQTPTEKAIPEMNPGGPGCMS
jgi:hypothetical protein